MTLTEIVVAVAVLGVAASAVTVSLASGSRPVRENLNESVLRRARADAVRRGESVTVTLTIRADSMRQCGAAFRPTGPRQVFATAFPDGSVVADTGLAEQYRCRELER